VVGSAIEQGMVIDLVDSDDSDFNLDFDFSNSD
jgi:hypothetical protein